MPMVVRWSNAGNGARCFVRYVHDHGLTDKTMIRVQTMCGLITPTLEADGMVSVDMGSPRFEPQQIPFLAQKQALVYALNVADEGTGNRRGFYG